MTPLHPPTTASNPANHMDLAAVLHPVPGYTTLTRSVSWFPAIEKPRFSYYNPPGSPGYADRLIQC